MPRYKKYNVQFVSKEEEPPVEELIDKQATCIEEWTNSPGTLKRLNHYIAKKLVNPTPKFLNFLEEIVKRLIKFRMEIKNPSVRIVVDVMVDIYYNYLKNGGCTDQELDEKYTHYLTERE